MAHDALLSKQTIPISCSLSLVKLRDHQIMIFSPFYFCSCLLLDFPEWETQIEEWQAPVLADTTLPEW